MTVMIFLLERCASFNCFVVLLKEWKDLLKNARKVYSTEVYPDVPFKISGNAIAA